MRQALLAFMLCTAVHAPALAQQASGLEGAWSGYFLAPNGAKVKADFTVRGTEGTWRAFVPQTQLRVNPCTERPHSVAITEVGPGKFKLVIQASKTLDGCQDAHATVSLVEPNQLEGKFGDGRELSLKRK
jgi:hypothetical protein